MISSSSDLGDGFRAVLKLVHLLDLIPTFEDEAEALASFRPLGYSAEP
jgi:hypothetical protein